MSHFAFVFFRRSLGICVLYQRKEFWNIHVLKKKEGEIIFMIQKSLH